MKLKVISTTILAFGISIPLASIAATQNQAQSTQAATGNSTQCNCSSQELPLSQSNQSDSAILTWANATAVATFSYNFVNYRDAIQNLSGFFTNHGWTEFNNALNASHNLDAVKDKKLIVSAVATAAPIILKKGMLDNVYSWSIQIPMLVSYQSSTEYSKQNIIVTMTIVRRPTVNAPAGIAIDHYSPVNSIVKPNNMDQKTSQ